MKWPWVQPLQHDEAAAESVYLSLEQDKVECGRADKREETRAAVARR
jgi:hypothetical protein